MIWDIRKKFPVLVQEPEREMIVMGNCSNVYYLLFLLYSTHFTMQKYNYYPWKLLKHCDLLLF